MKRKRTTIEDVAVLAGVSRQTVSRVLNNPDSVADETRARVLAVIEKLNYRPSASARSLASRRTFILGILTADLSDYTHARIIEGAEAEAREHGYMTFASGASAVLVMHGHSHEEGRTIRVDGSDATLLGRFTLNRQEIELHDHRTGRVRHIQIRQPVRGTTGHGGGDAMLIAAFVAALRNRSPIQTTARTSLESHLMAFAADEARLKGSVIDMDAYRRRAEAIAMRQMGEKVG